MDAFEKVQNLLTQAKALHKEGMRPGKAILKACFLGGFKIPSQGCVKDLSVFLTEDFTLVRGEWENSYKEVKSCMTYMYEEIKDIYHKELPMVDIWSLRGEDGVKARVLVNTEGLMYAKTYGEAHYVLTAVVTVAGLGRTNNWLNQPVITIKRHDTLIGKSWLNPMLNKYCEAYYKALFRVTELSRKLQNEHCPMVYLEWRLLSDRLPSMWKLAEDSLVPVFKASIVTDITVRTYAFLEKMGTVRVDGHDTEEEIAEPKPYRKLEFLYAEFLMEQLKLPKFNPEKERLRVKSIEVAKGKIESRFYNSFKRRERASNRARRNHAQQQKERG